MMERSSDLLFANQTRSALLEARHAAREDRGSVRLMLLACDGRGERFSQKIWDFGRASLAERWHAGKAAAERLLARIAELDALAPGSLEIHRLVVPNATAS